MDILSALNDNSILIIPSNLRKKVLKYFNDFKVFKNIKIMTFKELRNGLLFDFNNETIFYVMNKLNVSYQVALEYLNSMYYLNDEIKDDKYTFLNKLYNELDENNLIIKDTLFNNFLKSKSKLYVFGFNVYDAFNEHLLDLASRYISYEKVEVIVNTYQHTAYNCGSLYLEVKFVAEEISKLIDSGVALNNIYIANYSNEYRFILKYVFSKYNIPIHLNEVDSLYDTLIGKYVLDNLNLNKDVLIGKLNKVFDGKNNVHNSLVINKIFNLINTYYWCDDLSNVKSILIEEMKCIKIPSVHLSDEISVTSLINNVFSEDEYVFLIGFNDSNIPKSVKDDDYINDAIKPSFVDTSTIKNNKNKIAVMDAITSIKNLTITYKLVSSTNSYLPSYLLRNERISVEKIDNFISNYSDQINEIYLAECLDKLSKYNVMDENLSILLNNYKINYKEYNNDFSGINKDELIKFMDSNINLSYSALNNFYECPFKYYLNNILKLDDYESRFDAFVGSLFHKCLECCLESDGYLDKIYDDYIKEFWGNPTNGEAFFFELLKPEIKTILNIINEQYEHMGEHTHLYESKESFEIDKSIKFTIKGFVDKLLFIDNFAIIVDYKTGTKTIDKKKFKFGLDLQLPIYLYILSVTRPNIKVCGLYLQHILKTTKKLDKKNNYDKKVSDMKLDGYTLSSNISLFDDTYEASKIIKGLKVKDNEFTGNYFYNDDEVSELIELVKNKINEAIDDIESCNFKVHPIKLDKISGCSFCNFKDVCYKKPSNINYQSFESEVDDNE